MTRNWLQFRPIVVQFSLPRSPYATIITNIHNYDIATAFTPLRSGAYGAAFFFRPSIIYFLNQPCFVMCMCTRAYRPMRVLLLLLFYFGKGIILGSRRLGRALVWGSYEFWIWEGDRVYKQPAVPSRVLDVLPRRPGVISNFINQGVDSNSASLRAHHPQL